MSAPNCWICGDEATTSEHIIKKTDLKSLFPSGRVRVSPKGGLSGVANGLNSSKLKYGKSLCAKCNGSRTQKHDEAWTTFSDTVRTNAKVFAASGRVHLPSLFPDAAAWREKMLHVHLFMAKHLGCLLVETGNTTGLKQLAAGIRHDHAIQHFQIVLHLAGFDVGLDAHRSRLSLRPQWNSAFFFYSVAPISICGVYSPVSSGSTSGSESWNPLTGGEWMTFNSLPAGQGELKQ